MKKQKDKIKKILLLRTEHIGDYILSIPAIKVLREQFPKARIDLVVGPWNKELAEATPYIDKAIIFNNPLIERNITYIKLLKELTFGLLKYLKFFRKINKENYNLLINFSNRKISNLFLKFIKADVKISGTEKGVRRIQEDKRCLELVHGENDTGRIHLKFTENQKKKVEKFIKTNRLNKFYIIHPITPITEKNWPIERWAKICKKLNKNFVFIGSKKEKDNISKLIKDNNLDNCYNSAGLFSLLETFYLIEKSEKFIGLDSGPLHLAKLTKTPIIAIFGPTDEKIWGPIRKADKTIKKEDIQDISIEEVLKLIK